MTNDPKSHVQKYADRKIGCRKIQKKKGIGEGGETGTQRVKEIRQQTKK